MKINSQNHDATAFGNKIRIARRLQPIENGHIQEVYFALRGNEVLGKTGNNGAMDTLYKDVHGAIRAYTIDAKTYFATPIKDFVNGVSRKIKNPELRKRYNAIQKASTKTSEA